MSQPELSDPISIRFPVDLLADIEKIASASERTRSWVIVRALRRYLASEGAQILDAVEGRAELSAGKGYDLDDVIAEIETIIRSDRAA